MKYKVRINPSALHKIKRVREWYEDKAEGLGEDFYFGLFDLLKHLEENPKSFQVRQGNVRLIHWRKFPYSLH